MQATLPSAPLPVFSKRRVGGGRGLQGCAGPLCGETARQGLLCPAVTVLGGCRQYEQPPRLLSPSCHWLAESLGLVSPGPQIAAAFLAEGSGSLFLSSWQGFSVL